MYKMARKGVMVKKGMISINIAHLRKFSETLNANVNEFAIITGFASTSYP